MSERERSARRWTRIGGVGGLAAPVIAVLAVLGAGAGLWPPALGEGAVGFAVGLALVAAAVALVAIVYARRARAGEPAFAALGLVAALALLAMVGLQRYELGRYPDAHDAATGDEVPQFRALTVSPGVVIRMPELQPVLLPWSVPESVRRAARLGRTQGWRIAIEDPNGHVEATDVASAYGWEDAVALDFRAVPGGTAIAMRSAARRQRGNDGGRNAARIRGYLRTLKESVARVTKP